MHPLIRRGTLIDITPIFFRHCSAFLECVSLACWGHDSRRNCMLQLAPRMFARGHSLCLRNFNPPRLLVLGTRPEKRCLITQKNILFGLLRDRAMSCRVQVRYSCKRDTARYVENWPVVSASINSCPGRRPLCNRNDCPFREWNSHEQEIERQPRSLGRQRQ